MRPFLWSLLLVFCALPPILVARADAARQAAVVPASIVAGGNAIWTVTYTVGPDGLAEGAGLKVRLPAGFNTEYADPALAAWTSRAGVPAEVTAVLPVDTALPWPYVRGSPVVEVRADGALTAGDTISVQFGRPDAPYDAPQTVLAAEVLLAVDAAGDGRYVEAPPFPMLTTQPGPPHRAVLHAPSQVAAGQDAALRLLLEDEYGNPSWPADTIVRVSSSDPAFVPAGRLPGGPAADAAWLVTAQWGTPGMQRARAVVEAGGNVFTALSNPVQVSATAPEMSIYWGEPHSHGAMSHDAYGTDSFAYARDVAALDFYARTDHSSADLGIVEGLTDAEWAQTKTAVVAYDDPGHFATILGYEYSASPPSGHYNVYFDAADEDLAAIPLFRRLQYGDVLTLWDLLASDLPPGVSAFTVPHHTGVCWGPRFCSQVTFSPPYSNAVLRPAIEIYSTHGQSELYDPAHGLSYENSWPGFRSADGPYYAQDAWAQGERLGVIAGSDDHHAHPGRKGLTAVLAPELTRTAVLEAVRERRTYAVSAAQRILLELTIDGRPLGSEVVLRPGQPALVEIDVTGTAPLAEVELLAWDFAEGTYDAAGHPQFVVARRWEPEGAQLAARFSSTAVAGEGLYYLRLRQEGLVGGDEVWAWSSPIWISRDEGPRLVYLPLLR